MMRSFKLSALVLGLVSLLALPVMLLEASEEDSKKPSSGEETRKQDTPDRAQLEEAFRKTLTNATLAGRWRLVEDGKLGEEREEKYTVQSATKLFGAGPSPRPGLPCAAPTHRGRVSDATDAAVRSARTPGRGSGSRTLRAPDR